MLHVPTPKCNNSRDGQKKNTRDELQTKEASRTLILCQFTVLFQCALERTHPSIHPSGAVSQSGRPVLTTESHT